MVSTTTRSTWPRLAVLVVGVVAVALAAAALATTSSATAQLATDFRLSVSSGELPAANESVDVTVTLDPGESAVAAVGASLSYDDTQVYPIECVALVGLGACNLSTRGEISLQTVDPSGWATTTDLFTITFLDIGLTSQVQLEIAVGEAYDLSGVLIAGEADGGTIGMTLRGDVNCSSSRNVADALVIAQFTVGNRDDVGACPLPEPATQINATMADMNNDGNINIADALWVAQCAVGNRTC